MVASHNKASIERVAALLLGEYLGEGGGERSRVARERVYFGQLLGMGDNLTFTLARHALKAYKYVPDDPSREALPWPLMATEASRTASLIAPLIACRCSSIASRGGRSRCSNYSNPSLSRWRRPTSRSRWVAVLDCL